MYQVHFDCLNTEEFATSLHTLKQDLESKGLGQDKVVFHLYNNLTDRDVTANAAATLRSVFDKAPYIGCSASGNIASGELLSNDQLQVTGIATVFEDADTQIHVMQLPLSYETQVQTAENLIQAVAERPWVKAIEMLTTVADVHMPDFCKALSKIPEDIPIFGGGALSSESMDMYSGKPYVFSSAAESHNHAIVFVLYGGDQLHAFTQAITGWKPLGLPFRMTKADRSVLYELDGTPAYDIYNHYLRIKNDENFFQNSLLFPLAMDHHGMTMIKAAVKSNPDGSLTMTSDISDDHHECRISYGDPATILQSIGASATAMQEFSPDAILVYSCASRLLYWGQEYVSRETRPFQQIAPTAGFFTSGEFARYKGDLLQYNVTLVIAGLREGDCGGKEKEPIVVDDSDFSRQMTIVNTLTNFIGAASGELQDAYERMEILAKTDGLTGLYDRREIERIVGYFINTHAAWLRANDNEEKAALGSGLLSGSKEDGVIDPNLGLDAKMKFVAQDNIARVHEVPPTVIMLDLDDFKQVNDTFGHKAGDDVLRGLADVMRSILEESGLVGVAGRWGGEEFMILTTCESLTDASDLANKLRSTFEAHTFPGIGACTLSLGVAQARPGESPDSLCSRVDHALYAAKRKGKNCVVVD